MKRINTILAIVLLMLAFTDSHAQNVDDEDMLYVYTKTGDEAAMYQLDDVNKITFSDKGVQLWSTSWPTEYPYGNFKTISFRKIDNAFPLGDVNTDGKVDITDVVIAVNHILGNASPLYHEEYADMNVDGVVNVTDIILIVNVILNSGKANAPTASLRDGLSMTATDAKAIAKVQQGNAQQYLNIYQDSHLR